MEFLPDTKANYSRQVENYPQEDFAWACLSQGLAYTEIHALPSTEAALELVPQMLAKRGFNLERESYDASDGMSQFFFTRDNPNRKQTIAHFSNRDAYSTIKIASCNKAEIQVIIAFLKDNLPEPPILADNKIYVTFWWNGPTGPQRYRKSIYADAWNDITENYANTAFSTRDALSKLMRHKISNKDGGKLILWHGIQGAGKSRALLSLAREWSNWASVSYICDVDNYFHDIGYIMQTITETSAGFCADTVQPDDDNDEYGSSEPKIETRVPRASLIILEDAGELVNVDAKDRTGQAFSKLLNITDGLIGQGTNTYVLLTTNEPSDKIHPAIKRNGRCLADIEFGTLSLEESKEWCGIHGMPVPKDGLTLADLYALKNGETIATTRKERSIADVFRG